MNCMFCDKPMIKPVTAKVSHLTVYECFRCPRSVRFMYNGDTLEKYVIFLSKKTRDLRDELYAAIFWPEDDKAILCRAWASRRDGADYFEGYHFDQPMMTFGSMPGVTPENIHEKFKLYMLFS